MLKYSKNISFFLVNVLLLLIIPILVSGRPGEDRDGRAYETSNSKNTCGVRQRYGRSSPFYIYNGTPTSHSNHPWIVQIRLEGGRHRCGGTILTDDVILTAAHCKIDKQMVVVNAFKEEFNIEAVVTHPGYR